MPAARGCSNVPDALHRGVQFRSYAWRQKLICRLPFLILPPRNIISPRSNFGLHGRVIYNSHRKSNPVAAPLGDILCIRSPIYICSSGVYTRLCYTRTPTVLITCIRRPGLFSANWKVRLGASICSVPMLLRSRTEGFILSLTRRMHFVDAVFRKSNQRERVNSSPIFRSACLESVWNSSYDPSNGNCEIEKNRDALPS